jgi:hypothetical protein
MKIIYSVSHLSGHGSFEVPFDRYHVWIIQKTKTYFDIIEQVRLSELQDLLARINTVTESAFSYEPLPKLERTLNCLDIRYLPK